MKNMPFFEPLKPFDEAWNRSASAYLEVFLGKGSSKRLNLRVCVEYSRLESYIETLGLLAGSDRRDRSSADRDNTSRHDKSSRPSDYNPDQDIGTTNAFLCNWGESS